MKVAPENQSEPQSDPTWWDRNKKLVIWTCIAFLLGSGLACAIILPILLPTDKGTQGKCPSQSSIKRYRKETPPSSTNSTTITTIYSTMSSTSTSIANSTTRSTSIASETSTTTIPTSTSMTPTSTTSTAWTTSTTITTVCQEWQEWSDWTGCSVTCGPGTITRSRECLVDGFGTEQIEVDDCFIESCVSGFNLVHSVSQSLRVKGIEDNLFLNRYAHRVTDFGTIINQNDSNKDGYGIWRLTDDDLKMAIEHNLQTNLLVG